MDEDCGEDEEGREKCQGGCGRHVNVCLCTVLVSQAMKTSTHIVILQHPHEARHKLATVSLLNRCLSNCYVIVGRCLHGKSSSILDNICQSTCHVLLLFPGNEALNLNKWVSSSSLGMSMPTTQNEKQWRGIKRSIVVAHSLRTLEPTPIVVEIKHKLLSISHAMVAYQVHNLKPMRPYPKLLKKGSCPVSPSS
ncbi:uncharacterized protein LOC131874034 [Cryptomeria japonica]|uniref:uncharacterized protein LOC131874034 n=1 Tax=Cryptomeria japonica TaxID=3369 RepID=UPI0027D9DABF|nr:uncharacterized protein LOC131874034 [Cryptomeria japonica]